MAAASDQPEQPLDCCPARGTAALVQPSPDFWHPVPCPSCRHPLWFLRKMVGDVVVLRFLASPDEDSWDKTCGDDIRAAIGESTRVVANLGGLSRIDGGIVMEFLRIFRDSPKSSRRQLRLCGLQPSVAECLRVMRADGLFPVDVDEGQALARQRGQCTFSGGRDGSEK